MTNATEITPDRSRTTLAPPRPRNPRQRRVTIVDGPRISATAAREVESCVMHMCGIADLVHAPISLHIDTFSHICHATIVHDYRDHELDIFTDVLTALLTIKSRRFALIGE